MENTLARIQAPASKPITQRYLLAAALSSHENKTRIYHPLICGETLTMIAQLRAIGSEVHFQNQELNIPFQDQKGNYIEVSGRKADTSVPDFSNTHRAHFFGAGSGLVLRNFIGMIAGLQFASNQSQRVILTGDSRLNRRPFLPLIEQLIKNGAELYCLKDDDWQKITYRDSRFFLSTKPITHEEREYYFRPPVQIQTGSLSPRFYSNDDKKPCFEFKKSHSSQFASAALWSICVAYPQTECLLRITDDQGLPLEQHNEIFSLSYIEQTIAVIETCGANVRVVEPGVWSIVPPKFFTPPSTMSVEGDFTSISYIIAATILKGTRSIQNICITGLEHVEEQSLQGERCILDIAKQLGVEIRLNKGPKHSISLHCKPEVICKPKVVTHNIKNGPNITPTLMALAAGLPQGIKLSIRGTKLTLTHKTNRVAAMAAELAKINVKTNYYYDQAGDIDGFDIEGGQIKTPLQDVEFDYRGGQSAGDHRIAMSLATLKPLFKQKFSVHGLTDAFLSYPHFKTDLETLGLTFNEG